MKNLFNIAVLLFAVLGSNLSATAQTPVPPPTPDYQPLSDQQLDQLLGPIALYPDPLIAQILPAATLPTQIVIADRYISGGGDPNQIEQQPWDSSVQALAHYPNVLKWMDDNLNWTTELGQAFLNQQSDVMNSIQRLRAEAQSHGNLQTTPQQQVVVDDGQIEILPADPQIIYVPTYDPNEIYFDSGGPFITFGIGFGIGAWLDCDFDWAHRHLIVWNHNHPRPANWWHERPGQRDAYIGKHPATVWRPVNRPTFVGSDRGDRGWNNNPTVRHPAPINTHTESHPSGSNFHPAAPAIHDNFPKPVSPPPPQHFDAPSRPANNAFIGIQNSSDTRDFSNRGQASLRATEPAQHFSPPSAPVQHSSPSPSFGGGGGGGGGRGGGRH